MVDAAAAWAAVGTAWGLAAGPLGYWLRGRKERQNSLPNIRRQYAFHDGFFDCKITIHARTSEDIVVSQIQASGRISIGNPEPVFDKGGMITDWTRDWVDSPAQVEWLIKAGDTQTFPVRVDHPSDDASIRLIFSSSARTLKRRSAIIQPPSIA